MRGIVLTIVAATFVAGCSATPITKLECTAREQSPEGRVYKVRADLSDRDREGAWRLRGRTEYKDGGRQVGIPTNGYYLEHNADGKFELLTFSDPPGKLDLAVMPDHPVFKQRGIEAVVLTNGLTVKNAPGATVRCRTLGRS